MTSMLSRFPYITSIIILIFSVILSFRKWLCRKFYNRTPPGPTRWPIVGNLLTVKGKTYTEIFPKWRQKYGPIFRFYLGSKPVTVISDFRALHEAYINNGNDLASKPVCPSMEVTSNGYRDVRLAPYMDTLIVQRKLLDEALRNYVSSDAVSKCVNDVIQGVANHIAQLNGSGYKLDINATVHESMFQIMDIICFGDNISEREITPKLKPVLQNLQSLNENFAKFIEDVFPFLLKIWPTARFSRHKVDSKVIEDYVYYHYQLTKKVMDYNKPTNFTQEVIAIFNNVDSSFELTDIHLIKKVCDVFYGGVCPTAPTILWAIYAMCAYPGMQELIYDEVIRVMGKDKPSQAHLPKLVYTQAFVQEVWRLFPPLPIGVPHTALRNTQLRGYNIPKNSLFLVDYHAIHRDSRLFSNPLDFRPERFISQDGNDVIRGTIGYVPFSMGPRKCIGEDLARQLVIYTLSSLVKKVKISFPQGYKADFTKVKDTYYLTPEQFSVVTTAR